MNDKAHMLALLHEEFDRWEALLNSMSQAQITARQLPAELSIKDVVAHLHAWQQISIARLEAALNNCAPAYPAWVDALQADTEADNERTNAWIYEHYLDQPWQQVHQAWSSGFHRLLELGAQIPEQNVVDAKKYPWLHDYPLMAVIEGTYEHHHVDHFEPLQAWLAQHGDEASV